MRKRCEILSMTRPPTIVLTGASGLIGRGLLEELKNEYRIFAVARRTQQECGAATHRNIAWMRADITDIDSIGHVFSEIATAGGADYVLHLGAFYDFIHEEHPEYYRTNVCGTRNILSAARRLKPRLFVFASSVAACGYPAPGKALTEDSPPDGEHIYSWSKREGERMVLADSNPLPSCIVRLGAVFTDWCEYPPLYVFLQTWLGPTWKARILGGRGKSAIPYIHIRDVGTCFRSVMDHAGALGEKRIVLGCTSGSTSHDELFSLATRYFFGREKRPIHVPKLLAGMGLRAMMALSRIGCAAPFEKPWMLKHIDRRLDVNIDRTRALLSWEPNARRDIASRIPYMLERMKSEPSVWLSRNTRAMQKNPARPDFVLFTRLTGLEQQICDEILSAIRAAENAASFPFLSRADSENVLWFVRLLYRLLLASVENGNRLLLQSYFEATTREQSHLNAPVTEIIVVLRLLNKITRDAVQGRTGIRDEVETLQHAIGLPIEFAIDELEFRQTAQASPEQAATSTGTDSAYEDTDARSQLEETIWSCLVMRK